MEKLVRITNNKSCEYTASRSNINASFIPSQSNLIANIVMERWLNVNSILSSISFAQQIKNQSFSEPTPLHVVCSISSVPLEVVKSILNVYGDSCCLIEDEDGSLPIHKACSTPDLDPQIIQLLLQISPETSELESNSISYLVSTSIILTMFSYCCRFFL